MAQVKKGKTGNIPPIQIALDLIDLPRAIKIAEESVKGDAKAEEAVKSIAQEF